MATDVPAEGPQKVPTNPGILCVTSKSINTSVLDPLDFADWYENTHIQEIHQTGGFSDTQRYESLDFSSKHRGGNTSNVPETNPPYPFLTIYHMPDLNFRGSKEFASLSAKAKPDDQALEENLFKQAEFYSRFCELESVDWPNDGGPQTPYIATLTSSSSSKVASDLATEITKFSGCQRTRRYRIHEGSVLSGGNRTYVPEKSELFVFEFGELEALKRVLEKLPGGEETQVGLWVLRRAYSGEERMPVGWKPRK